MLEMFSDLFLFLNIITGVAGIICILWTGFWIFLWSNASYTTSEQDIQVFTIVTPAIGLVLLSATWLWVFWDKPSELKPETEIHINLDLGHDD